MTRPEESLTTHLVGGAVRDQLLGLDVKDRDWVVTGATPSEMVALGFEQVGRDFPVFLHPSTKEEYALARRERKNHPGYRGFTTDHSPSVTLEEDLSRRDLTINAMARNHQGQLIDPFSGEQDIEARLLRHVSPAFVEDPVRILRVARFAARFADLGFTVAPETLLLMKSMVQQGEVDALVAERVWQETHQALNEDQPARFIEILRECGALARIYPEIDALFGVPQPERYHPEVDTGLHTLMVVEKAARLSPDPLVRFGALLHDLGKALTPKERLPSHHGHEEAGVVPIRTLCERLRTPREYKEFAVLVSRFHLHLHRFSKLKPKTVLRLLVGLNAFRQPERLQRFITVCWADTRGRGGTEEQSYLPGRRLEECFQAASGVSVEDLAADGVGGAKIGKALERRRIEAITEVLKQSTESG